MTGIQGALGKIEEIASESLRQSCAVNPDGCPNLIELLTLCKAIREAVPDGVEKSIYDLSNALIQLEERDRKEAEPTIKAAQLLQTITEVE